jgi:hypothetical protein
MSAKLLPLTDDRITNVIFRVLEPCEGKLSCTVLRGERESNLPDLLDRTGLVYGGSSNNGKERRDRINRRYFDIPRFQRFVAAFY